MSIDTFKKIALNAFKAGTDILQLATSAQNAGTDCAGLQKSAVLNIHAIIRQVSKTDLLATPHYRAAANALQPCSSACSAACVSAAESALKSLIEAMALNAL